MAGVSAMAFFRSSLFVVRAGDRDVGVGPSGFLRRTMVYSPWSAFFARYAAHRFFIRPIPLVRVLSVFAPKSPARVGHERTLTAGEIEVFWTMCSERLQLEKEFAQAVARCYSALNEQLLAVMSSAAAWFLQTERAISDAAQEHQRAMDALMEYITKHGC